MVSAHIPLSFSQLSLPKISNTAFCFSAQPYIFVVDAISVKSFYALNLKALIKKALINILNNKMHLATEKCQFDWPLSQETRILVDKRKLVAVLWFQVSISN